MRARTAVATGVKQQLYRLEWRTPEDVAAEPLFALWQSFHDAGSLVEAAVQLDVAGRAFRGEFRVVSTDSVGRVEAEVMTVTEKILGWNTACALLPLPAQDTSWVADLARAEAATQLLEGIRVAAAGAVKAGALDGRSSLELMSAVREALDQQN